MKWNKFRLKTTTEAEDIVSSMLADLGIEGVEIEDKIPLTESDKEPVSYTHLTLPTTPYV